MWLFFPNFLGFLVGFILWGVKSAFTHGTYQGLIYDHLKDEGREGDYARVIGRTKACSYAAIMLASVGASLAVKFGGYPLVLAFSVASGVIAALVDHQPEAAQVALSPSEDTRGALRAGGPSGAGSRRTGATAWRSASSSSSPSCMASAGRSTSTSRSSAASRRSHWRSSPCSWPALSAAQAIVSLFVHRFEALPLAAIYLMFAAAGGLMVAASLMLGWGSLGLLCSFSGLYVIVSTTIEVKIQHLIPSAVRATATSVQGFVVEIATLSVYFGFGALAAVRQLRPRIPGLWRGDHRGRRRLSVASPGANAQARGGWLSRMTVSETQGRPAHSVGVIVAVCACIAALEGYDIQAVGVSAPSMAPALHMPEAFIGYASSISMAGLIVGAIIGGWIADRIGRRPVLAFSVAWFGVFSIATAMVQTPDMLLILRLLTGLAFGGAMPNMIVVASEASAGLASARPP